MKLQDAFKHPEYLYRPRQIFIRASRRFRKPNKFESVALPWGTSIKIQPGEDMGLSIWNTGLYDLTVSEVLWRLIDDRDVAVDVGANIGYMTGVMAHRVGRNGRVVCFEPNPEIFEILVENINNWKPELGVPIDAHRLALSNRAGQGMLGIPNEFKHNHGLAALIKDGTSVENVFHVELSKLEALIKERIDLLKIDVEGHEYEVLQGAEQLLNSRNIRDIVFEEHNSYPTPVTRLLEDKGYTIFNLGQTLTGLKINSIKENPFNRAWEPRSCLATIDAARATQRLQKSGWATLRGGRN